MTTVYIPFDLPMYGKERNSHHPLLAGLYRGAPYGDISFVGPLPESAAAGNKATVDGWIARLRPVLEAALPDPIGGKAEAVGNFIDSREPAEQAQTDMSADIAFFHTTPLTLLQQPFVLHTETLITLFSPQIMTGYSGSGLRLRNEPVYWMIRAYLESPACTGIFTNLRRTRDGIERIFDSPAITAKTRHFTAGPNLTAAQRQRLAEGYERKRAKTDDIEILFTNSWHQHPTNFLLRGGHDLVGAFLAISQAMPNVRLTMRTSVPEDGLSPDFIKVLRTHPRITLLEQPMSDDEIVDLYAGADIFVLHAAALHSMSVLRATYAGCASLVSDAPGYEEYLVQGETGFMMPGMRQAIYTTDPESGFEHDNYRIFLQATKPLFQPFAHQLFELCRNAELRRRLGAAARERALAADGDASWRRGFETLIREGAARRRGGAGV